MIARKVIGFRPPNTALGVLPSATVRMPEQGFWRLEMVSAYLNAAAAAAVVSATFTVVDAYGVTYAQGHLNCGVAAFDSNIAWQKDGPEHVPTLSTHFATAPCPSNVWDGSKGLRLVLTALAGSDVAQLSDILIVATQILPDDGANL